MEIDASYIKGMLNNLDIQPRAAVNRWIVGIKPFHFKLVHVPGTQHNGPDGLSWHMPSLNDPLPVDDSDNWLDKAMSFAVILMNSAPSWSVQLTSSGHTDNQARTDNRPAVFLPPLAHLSASAAYFVTDDTSSSHVPDIPHSALAQSADAHLKAIRDLLSNPLSLTGLSHSQLQKLVHYASKFFILDGRLMHRDIQARHKIVLPIEKHFTIISHAHEAVGHRAIYSPLTNIRERFW